MGSPRHRWNEEALHCVAHQGMPNHGDARSLVPTMQESPHNQLSVPHEPGAVKSPPFDEQSPKDMPAQQDPAARTGPPSPG